MELDDQSKGNYQPWNHEVFMADRRVRRMKSQARKAYVMLLHEMFFCTTRPYHADEDSELCISSDCDTMDEWLKVKPEIMPMFEQVQLNGRKMLYHKRVAEDWDRMVDAREERVKKARAGGKASAAKRKAKHLVDNQELDENIVDDFNYELTPSQPEVILAQLSKSKSKRELKKESEEEENDDFSFSKTEENLHGEEMNATKQIPIICKTILKVYADMTPTNTAMLKALEVVHKGSAVVNLFTEWAKEHKDDGINKPISAFLKEADDLFSTPSSFAKSNPENGASKRLSNEITYISNSDINLDKKQIALVVTAMTEDNFTEEDVITVFKKFNAGVDRTNSFSIDSAARNFSQIVPSLLNTLRRRKQEAESEQTLMDAAREKMTKEANERVAEMLRKEKEDELAAETELG